MGLFRKDPAKRAARIAKRAERKQARADAARAKAEVYEAAAQGQSAAVIGRRRDGSQVRQQVQIEDPRLEALIKRVTELESQMAAVKADNESLQEEVDSLEAEAQEAYAGTLSALAGVSGFIRAAIQMINLNDKVQSPIGLVLADGLDALADQQAGNTITKQRMQLGSTAAKAYAYWGDAGLSDVVSVDKPVDVDGYGTLPAEVADLRTQVDALTAAVDLPLPNASM